MPLAGLLFLLTTTLLGAVAFQIRSPVDPSVTITYESPNSSTCATIFSTQKQYSGYITLPPSTLGPVIQQNYSINTFFWFFESRVSPETAPLTIWLNGGPGSSSMIGLFKEVGPCEVVQGTDGTYRTQPRTWGWDRTSNILFVDQPAQVGFSYDTLTNGSFYLANNTVFYPPSPVPDALHNASYLWRNGTFASGNTWGTTNTTQIAARAAWHFLQSFLSAFPQYNPGTRPDSTAVNATGVNLFAESYGGRYGPVFAEYFQEQNLRRSNGSLSRNTTLEIQLESLGIVNGLVDELIQAETYPYYAFNNTYGIQVISQTDQLNGISSYSGSQGCEQLTLACRTAVNVTDPEGEGDVDSTNSLCQSALRACTSLMEPYAAANYSVYDIRVKDPSPDPGASHQEFLNQANVMAAIGAKVNYTDSNAVVQSAFIDTGDEVRGEIPALASLLQSGVRIALIYGDADYICNWLGGEAVSFALANALPNATISSSPTSSAVSYGSGWASAGYADIVVNSTYVGGAVRQFGNLSFSRIYDAGHFVPYFQPETAFTVFARVIQGTDLSTGEAINLSNFSSTGPKNATHTNVAPSKQPSPTCWIRALEDTCSDDDISSIEAGSGMVSAGIWYSATPTPARTMSSSSTASTTTTVPPVGVFTATGTPEVTHTGAAVRLKPEWAGVVVEVLRLVRLL